MSTYARSLSTVKSLATFVASLPFPASRRWQLLSAVGVVKTAVGMERGVRFWNTNVSIGAGSYLNREATFEGKGQITVGNRVAIGPGVMILTSTHDMGPSKWRAGGGVPAFLSVSIGDGSWIGARATILPGVTIGRGCVIAAGSVVREDCPDDTLWAGVPAKLKRDLPAGADHASSPVAPASPAISDPPVTSL